MPVSLSDEFQKHRSLSPTGIDFLQSLESSIAQDLWQSCGGHWSRESVERFRSLAMQKFAATLASRPSETAETPETPEKPETERKLLLSAWVEVVRDFHQDQWQERPLAKKEKKILTEQDRIFKELFAYIWVLLQTLFVTKTAVFYFGLKSAQEDSSEGKIYVFLAILFSFGSLFWFAYRKSKKDPEL